jgi:DNA repair exonuclease SbcCD nuclease subunit
MHSVKIVQSGDFHLDSPLVLHHLSFRPQRREELLLAVRRLVDHALSVQADLLLLAGDLFDSARVTRNTLDYLHREFSRFSGRIFITPGNHDPYTLESPYATDPFPPNTHVFGDYEEIFLPELHCVVCGQGFREAVVTQNLLAGINAPATAPIKILLLHGEVTSSPSRYNPMTRESLRSSGFSYVALGHRHEFSGIQREGTVSYAYAGIPEGRGFDELGEKGVITGEVFSDGVNLKFQKLAKRTYEEVPVDLTGCLTHQEMLDRILGSVNKAEIIPKILLRGEIPPYAALDEARLDGELSRHLEEFSLVDLTKVAKDQVPVMAGSLKGIFLSVIEERQARGEGNPRHWEEARKMGLRILSQEEF